MTETVTRKDRIIKRIKHRTPELIVGVSVAAGAAAMIWIKHEHDLDMALLTED